MLYSIQLQAAALVLMLIIGALLTEKMTIRMHTQKAYMVLYLSITISICADIISVIFIQNSSFVGLRHTELAAKIYLFSVVFVAFCILQYILSDIHQTNHFPLKPRTFISFIPLLVEIGILIMCPIKIYCEGYVVYSYGFCVQMTYWCALFYLLVTLLYTFVFFHNMSRYVCTSMWFLIGVWMLAAIIQLLYNNLLIVSFAMSIGVVLTFIKLENPNAFVDNEIHVYNSYAYAENLQKLFASGKKMWIISLRIEGITSVNEDFGLQLGRELLCTIVNYLKQTGKKVIIYRTGVSTFSIFYKDDKELLEAVTKIEKRFENPWFIDGMFFDLKSHVAYLDDSSLVGSVNELIDVLHYFVNDER